MKYLIAISLSIFLSITLLAQVEVEGEARANTLTLEKGEIFIVDDIDGGAPRLATITNSLGDLDFRTFGSTGSLLSVLRDGGLDFKLDNATAFNINDDGRVSIGAVSNTASVLNIKQSLNKGGIRLENHNGPAYNVHVNDNSDYTWALVGTTGSAYLDSSDGFKFVNSSDKRLKRNIKPYNTKVLDKISMLVPCTYSFKDDKTNSRSFGMIAQEVEKVFPELVHTGGNGYKALAYSDFGLLAIKAIQEQQQIISDLQERIAELESK